MLSKIFYCCILDSPDAMKPKEPLKSNLKLVYGGDYADEYSFCRRCKKVIYRDNHMFGDGEWRHLNIKSGA